MTTTAEGPAPDNEVQTEADADAAFLDTVRGMLGDEEPEEEAPPAKKAKAQKEEPEGPVDESEEPEESEEEEGSEEPEDSDEPEEDDIKVSIRINGKKASVEDLLGNTAHQVVVDGEEMEVDYTELVKGYQRGADYSRKTKEIKDMKQELNPFLQMVSYAKHDPGFVSHMERYFQSGGFPESADNPLLQVNDAQLAEMMDENSEKYDRDKAFQVMQARQKWQSGQAERQKVNQQVQQEMLGRYNEWAQGEVDRAKELINAEFGEEAYDKKAGQVLEFLGNLGFNEAEVSGRVLLNATDSRLAVMAFKAAEFDRMVQEADAPRVRLGKKRKKLAPPGSSAATGGTRRSSSRNRQRDSYRRAVTTQNSDDWIKVIKGRIE